jgi:hypothetical protein
MATPPDLLPSQPTNLGLVSRYYSADKPLPHTEPDDIPGIKRMHGWRLLAVWAVCDRLLVRRRGRGGRAVRGAGLAQGGVAVSAQVTGTERIVRLPTLPLICHYCGGQLPPSWTKTVDGKLVHFGCASAAPRAASFWDEWFGPIG